MFMTMIMMTDRLRSVRTQWSVPDTTRPTFEVRRTFCRQRTARTKCRNFLHNSINRNNETQTTLVGGVAQSLGRRSLACELSMVDMW